MVEQSPRLAWATQLFGCDQKIWSQHCGAFRARVCWVRLIRNVAGKEVVELDDEAGANGDVCAYYNGARWYMPEYTRYTQMDPAGFVPNSVINPYVDGTIRLSFLDACAQSAAEDRLRAAERNYREFHNTTAPICISRQTGIHFFGLEMLPASLFLQPGQFIWTWNARILSWLQSAPDAFSFRTLPRTQSHSRYTTVTMRRRWWRLIDVYFLKFDFDQQKRVASSAVHRFAEGF